MWFRKRCTQLDYSPNASGHSLPIVSRRCKYDALQLVERALRALLVHPQDHPRRWASQKWDLIVDLSWAPANTYAQWTREFQCPAVPFQQYCRLDEDVDFIRYFISKGASLTDAEGIRWWELFVLFFSDHAQLLVSVCRLAESFNCNDQVFITRPCMEADMLQRLGMFSVHLLSGPKLRRKLLHYAGELWALPFWELRQIFWDKYDAGFTFRRHFARKKDRAKGDVILVPSAYVNATKTAASFASKLSDVDFLLVTTRASGKISNLPANVTTADLAGYACRRESAEEYRKIMQMWRELRRELALDPKTSVAYSLGLWEGFPEFVKRGLKIRDAWLGVLEREPVKSVLCCDNNPYTLLPVLLGQRRNIATVSCHHGALDWRYRVVPAFADMVIAKSEMEQDYLSRVCGIPASKIQTGAPDGQVQVAEKRQRGSADAIVFFSEPYEANKARGNEIYNELLPSLADMAIKEGRKLIIKLHPFESVRRRKALVRESLSLEQRRTTKIVAGPLTSQLLEQAWFGVTVLSTVAMECAAAGVPCFLCQWLEYPHHEYGEQFRRFGVGHTLRSGAELLKIPAIIKNQGGDAAVTGGLAPNISTSELERLFSREERPALLAAI